VYCRHKHTHLLHIVVYGIKLYPSVLAQCSKVKSQAVVVNLILEGKVYKNETHTSLLT
jgi:hypothetical protein